MTVNPPLLATDTITPTLRTSDSVRPRQEPRSLSDASSRDPGPDAVRRDPGGCETPVLLHIGYHKTASSLLQTTVFDRADQGFMRPLDEPRHQLVVDFVRPGPFGYAPETMRAKYRDHLETASRKNLTMVLSHERLSGYPPSGGYDSRTLADRLHATFPEASVLIVIREQVGLISSMYSQYVTDGGDMGLKNYLTAPQPHLMRMPSFSFDFYEFDRLIGYYQALFGEDRVLVMPYEILRRHPAAFVERISGFCGRPGRTAPVLPEVNRQRPMLMQTCQRHINRIFSDNQLSRQALVPCTRLARGFRRLQPAFDLVTVESWDRRLRRRQLDVIEAAVGDCYGESNRRTSELIGVDLADYGYFCGG